MRRGMVDFCLLATLNQKDDYGYAIVERLNETNSLSFSESTVYPALNRMVKDGLLVSYRGPSQDGPPRRYYGLSPQGRERLSAMKRYWSDMQSEIDLLIQASHKGQPQ